MSRNSITPRCALSATGEVTRRLAGNDPAVNEEWNCDKGRWAFTYATQPDRLEHGEGTEEDVEKMLDVCDNITGRAFCALGDSATPPVTSAAKYFRDEFMQHHKEGGCPFDPAASTVWSET